MSPPLRPTASTRSSAAGTPSPARPPSIHKIFASHSGRSPPLRSSPTSEQDATEHATRAAPRSSFSPSDQVGLPSPPATNSDTTGSIGRGGGGRATSNERMTAGDVIPRSDLQRTNRGSYRLIRPRSRLVQEEQTYHNSLRHTGSLKRSASPEFSTSPLRLAGDSRSSNASHMLTTSRGEERRSNLATIGASQLPNHSSRFDPTSSPYGELAQTPPSKTNVPHPRSSSAASSSSASGSYVRDRVENIEAQSRRVASASPTTSASRRDATRDDTQTTPKTASLRTGSKRTSLHSPASRYERNLSNNMTASPARSSTTLTRANDEDNDDTLVLSGMNRKMSGADILTRQGSQRFAEMQAWQDEGKETRQMDAEEKVDMWRNGGAQEEPDSGGSSAPNRRSALPIEFRSNVNVSMDRLSLRETNTQSLDNNKDLDISPSYILHSSTRHRLSALSALEGNGLPRSTSLRSPARRVFENGRLDNERQKAERSHLAALRLTSGSVMGPRPLAEPSQDQSDRWETGTARTRHSSLMPSRTLQDMGGPGLTAVEADRAESRLRRAALLSSMDGTPERSTSLRQRGTSTEPRMGSMAGSRIRPSTSMSSYISRSIAPNSAPANARMDRQIFASLRDSQNSDLTSRLPDSPLDNYRPSTRMSHRMTASQSELGSTFSRAGHRPASRAPTRSEASHSSAGTPSRIVLARLLAAMRSASSHQARLMIEACMTLVERTATQNGGTTTAAGELFEAAQSSVSSADGVNARLARAMDVVQQQLMDSESASPEEAQVIAIAGYQQLTSIIRDALRDSEDHQRHLTQLLQTMANAVADKSEAMTTSGAPAATAHQRLYSMDSPSVNTYSPARDRLDSLRTRLVSRPSSPHSPQAASPTKLQEDREVRRMSSEIMRTTTAMDSWSPRNRFPNQTRRSPALSSRTSGEYFSAAESSNSRRSPKEGLPERAIHETGDEGMPKRTNSIFRRFQRSPLKSSTVPLPTDASMGLIQTSPERHLGLKTRSSNATVSAARAGNFMPQMAMRTPTTALSAVNATTELSPVADYFDAQSEHARASLDAGSLRSEEVMVEDMGRKERRESVTQGALKKMSSFIKGRG